MIISNGFVDLFIKTTSEAAYASSLLKGKGDKIAADQAAVDKMRLFLNNIPNSFVNIVFGLDEQSNNALSKMTNCCLLYFCITLKSMTSNNQQDNWRYWELYIGYWSLFLLC